MINKDTYKRLTARLANGKAVVDFIASGAGRIKTADRLAELEDKITDGTLIEVLKIGDTATAVIDTLAYDNSVQKVKIEGLAYIVKDENGDITFQHISRLFPNEEEAEAKLKEL